MRGRKNNPKHVPPRLKRHRCVNWEPPKGLPSGYTAEGGSIYGRFSVRFLGERIGFIERENGGKKWNIKPDLNGPILDSRARPESAVLRLHQLYPAELERRRLQEEKFQREQNESKKIADSWQQPVYLSSDELKVLIPGVVNARYDSHGELTLLEILKPVVIVTGIREAGKPGRIV